MFKKRNLIKWLDLLKGLVPLSTEEESVDIFVHYSAIDPMDGLGLQDSLYDSEQPKMD